LTAAHPGRQEAEARKIAHRLWPNEQLPGALARVLPNPFFDTWAREVVPRFNG
jgi:hypothetical protein